MSSAQPKDDQYEVQKILKKRIKNGREEYLIKWLGWQRPQDLTWEPLEHLQNVINLVTEFEANEKSKKIFKTKSIQKQRPQKVHKQKSNKLNESSDSNSHGDPLLIPSSSSSSSSSQSSSSHKKSPLRKRESQKRQKLEKKKSKTSNLQSIDNKLKKKPSSVSEKYVDSIYKHYIISDQSSKNQLPANLKIGHINHFFISENNKLFYDVDIVLKQSDVCVGAMKMSSSELIEKYGMMNKLADFLQTHLIEYEKRVSLYY